ncbi:hypothetical protein [Streptomyces rimosus]|uniref:hypothetical protein n=1 Tax=Streptomyces rimosus TaxID=1927 RepID=UPI0004C2A04F|nr:hypothetical protein [Streptomyces rimosus]
MNDAPRRLPPDMDRASAAMILGCQPRQVGFCVRCRGLTVRYGAHAKLICPWCHWKETATQKNGAKQD